MDVTGLIDSPFSCFMNDPAVRPLLVGAENLLPDHPVPVAGQPRMPASDGILYLQTRM